MRPEQTSWIPDFGKNSLAPGTWYRTGTVNNSRNIGMQSNFQPEMKIEKCQMK
jgi:hypothetical protein